MTFLWRALASGLGAGRAPFAPGTAGTLVAVPLAWALTRLGLPLHLLVLAASVPAAAAVCGAAAREDGRKDPGWIVLDEILGYCVAVFGAPPGASTYVAGFVLFRLFDILKPPPAGWVDRSVPGGWGILLDDIVAGLYARLALVALTWLAAPR